MMDAYPEYVHLMNVDDQQRIVSLHYLIYRHVRQIESGW